LVYEHQDFKQWQKQKVLYLASGLARNDRTLGVSEFYANMRLPHILHVATFFAYFNRMHISHIFPHRLAFLMAILIILIFFVMSILRHKHRYTHSFNGPLSGTTQVSRYRKVKPISILLKQETVNGSGISWAICKSAHRSRQITMLAPHHSVFLQSECPFCHPTNIVKALKAWHKHW